MTAGMTQEEAARVLDSEPLLYNEFISLKEHPDEWPGLLPKLTAALDLIAEDESWSLRHHLPPPNWTVVGAGALRDWYAANPQHPAVNDTRAREVRRAAQDIMMFARVAPSAFSAERRARLHRSICHWDASVRFDLVRAVAWLGGADVREPLTEMLRLDGENGWTPAVAREALRRLGPASLTKP